MSFSDRAYTRDALIKQAGLIELHCKDGSALNAGCLCIETKHLYFVEALAEEGVGFSVTEKERKFFQQLADLSRLVRKRLEAENFDLHGAMRQVMSAHGYKTPLRIVHNPRTRAFLPHNLTICERKYASVRKKLAACIKQAEISCCGKPTLDYLKCSCNPVAVCRSSIPCPPS